MEVNAMNDDGSNGVGGKIVHANIASPIIFSLFRLHDFQLLVIKTQMYVKTTNNTQQTAVCMGVCVWERESALFANLIENNRKKWNKI